jgi:hypothetical protein
LRTVGILVDLRVFNQIKSGKTGNERLTLYNKAASKLGLTPVYLCLERLSPSMKSAYGWTYSRGTYRYGQVSVPKIIHNRALPGSKRMRSRLKRLNRVRYVFNSKNRYSKYRIHRLLTNSSNSSHLPRTSRYSPTTLTKMMSLHGSLYIKPQNGSVGKGIAKLTRSAGSRWILQLPNQSSAADKKILIERLNRFVGGRKYLVQEAIPLAKYRGRPYDIRVSVQRGAQGEWQISGMVGKVARRGSHVTNVARGGHVKSCETLFRSSMNSPKQAMSSVKKLSLDITRFLGSQLPNLADVGLDIGVDSSGKPYFIEMNGRDQRYSFRKAGMHNAFRRTYENPLQYAKYVMDRSGG